jgi:hypothetical protein
MGKFLLFSYGSKLEVYDYDFYRMISDESHLRFLFLLIVNNSVYSHVIEVCLNVTMFTPITSISSLIIYRLSN